jgi:hypothetical protein
MALSSSNSPSLGLIELLGSALIDRELRRRLLADPEVRRALSTRRGVPHLAALQTARSALTRPGRDVMTTMRDDR